MTYYQRDAWIDRAASVFAGLALAVAMGVIFWPWIEMVLR